MVGGKREEAFTKVDPYYSSAPAPPPQSGYDQWGQPLGSTYDSSAYYGDKQKYAW